MYINKLIHTLVYGAYELNKYHHYHQIEKWHSQRQQDLLLKEGKFKHIKLQELIALQKRIQTGREEQKKQRHQDLERLLQRYQNVKAELEAQQNLERVRMEKLVCN
jgi:hypothetical protein